MDSNAVQLIGGETKAIDAGDPRPIADRFGRVGETAVIDLDAALGKGSNADVVTELIARAPCRVGGGIRSVDAAIKWLDAGARKVILGTAATPDVLRELPRKRVIAALDDKDGEVVTNGWTRRTGVGIEERIDVYSNAESVRRSIEEQRGVYYSRSRGGLWAKGESSGNTQHLLAIDTDCDRDALRFTVRQQGTGFCHLGTTSCFGDASGLAALDTTIARRIADAPAGSYTRRLLDDPSLLLLANWQCARHALNMLRMCAKFSTSLPYASWSDPQ